MSIWCNWLLQAAALGPDKGFDLIVFTIFRGLICNLAADN